MRWRGDGLEKVVFPADGTLNQSLKKLDALAEGAAFVLGHNLIRFDLPQLAAYRPDMTLLALPALDTLCLNPLAHPKNPSHHLVKQYQDGKLQAERLNDPELDARLALAVFRDQQSALADMNRDAPGLVLAWHWLATLDNQVSGFNAFFTTLRRAPKPTDAQALAAIGEFLSDKACATATRAVLVEARQQPWPGCRWPGGIPSCPPGCATSSRRPAS